MQGISLHEIKVSLLQTIFISEMLWNSLNDNSENIKFKLVYPTIEG